MRTLSGGALDIAVYAAGEVVPAFEVLDAVGNGVADIGHTASFYWQGKMPAAAFFTTVPFGLTPSEHVAWIEAGGGQALWDELYAPFGVKPFMGGNTGVCMGGWFRRELKSLADLRGLKLRSLGLGGEVYRRLGATPQTTPPAEILISLQSGVIDGAEFVGPGTDIALGLYRVAPFYYYPGFNKPNGTGECIVALKAWNALSGRTQGDRRACLRDGGELRAGRDGAAQRAGAGRAREASTASSSRRFPTIWWPPRASRPPTCSATSPRAAPSPARCTPPTPRSANARAPWSRVSIEAVLRASGAEPFRQHLARTGTSRLRLPDGFVRDRALRCARPDLADASASLDRVRARRSSPCEGGYHAVRRALCWPRRSSSALAGLTLPRSKRSKDKWQAVDHSRTVKSPFRSAARLGADAASTAPERPLPRFTDGRCCSTAVKPRPMPAVGSATGRT